jgi:hypothetical protein
VHLVTSEELERDERATYLALIDDLRLAPTQSVEKILSGPRQEDAGAEATQKVHDWTRSVASLNRYWKDVLTAEDLESVRALTSDLVPHLFGGRSERQAPVQETISREPRIFSQIP